MNKQDEDEDMKLIKSPKDMENERYYMLNKAMIKNRKLAEQLPDQNQVNMFSNETESPMAVQNTSFVDPVIVSSLKARIANEPDPLRQNLLVKKLTDYMESAQLNKQSEPTTYIDKRLNY